MYVFEVIKDHTGEEVMRALRRLADDASIPEDDANVDYRAYLEWAAVHGPAEEVVSTMPDPVPPALESTDGRRWHLASVDESGVPLLVEVQEEDV